MDRRAFVADLLAGKDVPRDTPLTAPLLRLPLPFYLATAYVVYGVKDRWA